MPVMIFTVLYFALGLLYGLPLFNNQYYLNKVNECTSKGKKISVNRITAIVGIVLFWLPFLIVRQINRLFTGKVKDYTTVGDNYINKGKPNVWEDWQNTVHNDNVKGITRY